MIKIHYSTHLQIFTTACFSSKQRNASVCKEQNEQDKFKKCKFILDYSSLLKYKSNKLNIDKLITKWFPYDIQLTVYDIYRFENELLKSMFEVELYLNKYDNLVRRYPFFDFAFSTLDEMPENKAKKCVFNFLTELKHLVSLLPIKKFISEVKGNKQHSNILKNDLKTNDFTLVMYPDAILKTHLFIKFLEEEKIIVYDWVKPFDEFFYMLILKMKEDPSKIHDLIWFFSSQISINEYFKDIIHYRNRVYSYLLKICYENLDSDNLTIFKIVYDKLSQRASLNQKRHN